MTISDYAQANKLAPDIALTHMLVFSLVEAAVTPDEGWQRRTFDTLVRAVDAPKFAAAIRELAKELATPAVAQNHESGEIALKNNWTIKTVLLNVCQIVGVTELPIIVSMDCGTLYIRARGYGRPDDPDDQQVMIEFYGGRFQVHCYNDINGEGIPVTVDMEGAREELLEEDKVD